MTTQRQRTTYPPIAGTPGDVYEQHIVPAIFSRWAPDLVDAAGVRQGARVLDVACGTGAVTRIVAQRVGPSGKVVGLDVNAGVLAVARTAAPASNIQWLEGNAASIALPDASFDAVVCQQGLQFFPDRPAGLAEMRRVLKPGGRLALSCWLSVKHQPWIAIEQALAKRIGAEQAALPPFGLGDAPSIRSLLANAGFRDIRLRTDAKPARFHSSEHLMRATVAGSVTMMGQLTSQGPGVLDAIVAEVSEALRDFEDDDGVALPIVSHIFTASA
ncbi:MAG: class I SAM-dependent methyltransferase [Chloroflexi bacterium]|nr:class I SAM-dependent methyltransferase [Chloroflexota bacterium]